jgi:hypothetical protein
MKCNVLLGSEKNLKLQNVEFYSLRKKSKAKRVLENAWLQNNY